MHKKFPLFICLLCLFLLQLVCQGEAFASSSCPDSLVLTGTSSERSGTPLYEKAGQRGKKLLQIPRGKSFDILGKNGFSYHVVYQGKKGYVSKNQVTLGGRASAEKLPILSNSDLTLKDPIPAKPKQKRLSLQGTVRADDPIEAIEVFLWDERKMQVDMAYYIPLSTPAKTVNAASFASRISLTDAPAGRKMAVVQAVSNGKTYVAGRMILSIRGAVSEPAHITGKCKVSSDAVLNASLKTFWSPTGKAPSLKITLPQEAGASLLTMTWKTIPKETKLTFLDSEGKTISTETLKTGFYVDHAVLPEHAKKIIITPNGKDCAMSVLRVYGPKFDPLSVQQWQTLPEKTDILFFSTHQDDELLFFGGAIPYYSAMGRKVAVVYATDGGRFRYQEALDGLWATGLKYYPVFLGWHNFKAKTLQGALRDWNKHNGDVQRELVRLLRRYKPEVVVTQGFDGEYGHPQHMATAYLMAEAISLAADPAYDPDSAAGSGVWQIKKMYVHGYKENALTMNWSKPLTPNGVITPLFLAKEGYDRHPSQHGGFSIEATSTQYDCRRFGLYYTAVGPDVEKNDFFENIPES